MKKQLRALRWLIVVLIALVLMSYAAVRAVTFSAAQTGNWNSTNTWTPAGLPTAADDVFIGENITVSVTAAGAAVRNITVVGSGALSINANDVSPVLNIYGNITNHGRWMLGAGAGNSTTVTYHGADGVITGAGAITNQIATFTGNYTLLPGATFSVGNKNTGVQHLLGGTGSLVNQGTIIYNSGDQPTSALTNPDITSLDSSAPGSTFILKWTNVAQGHNVVRGITFYNFVYMANNGTGCDLSLTTINGNLTFDNLLALNGGSCGAWPANGVIGGKIIYKTTSSAAAFPAVFSIAGLTQSAGTLAVPTGDTLTVNGVGTNAWSRSGGFIAGAGTVRFTGPNPILSGSGSTRLGNLLIDSTANNASATASLYVSNALTIAQGGSLDVSALGTYSLSVTQSVFNSGLLKGNVDADAASRVKIFAGADGGYGTGNFIGNLSLGSTNDSVNLDVNTSAAFANDLLAVSGALMLNNTVFNLKAPSVGAPIDTADYILVTAGNISGLPVLNWVTAPASASSYSLVVSGNSIKLHYGTGGSLPVLYVSATSNTLTLTWDTATFPGYSLQSKTSASGIVGGSWSSASGPDASPFNTPINLPWSPVFYRLVKP